MRLFVAIPLPEPTKKKIEELYEPMDGLRWQDLSQMHLTLRFIGDVSKEVAGGLQASLSEIDSSPCHLVFTGVGHFSRQGSPRIIWVGVKKSEKLAQLQSGVEEICRQAGLDPERRAYKPHITIAKNKYADDGEIYAYIDRQQEVDIDPVTADRFILYSSTLTSEGAIHEPVKEFSMSRADVS